MRNTFLQSLYLSRFRIYLRPLSDIYLPGYKGAVFRGGFGSVFKSLACPTHELDCLQRRLDRPCVYSQVFETPVPSDSVVMRKYPFAPHPFVLTPSLERRALFTPHDELRLELVLVGSAIHLLGYFICTLEELGRRGIGPARGRYRLERVECIPQIDSSENGGGTPVYNGTTRQVVGAPLVLKASTLFDTGEPTSALTLSFQTPVRIVSGERLATEIHFPTLFRSLLRRLALLTYFHCDHPIDASELRGLIAEADAIHTRRSALRWRDWERYSTRQKARMNLGGLMGEVTYEGEFDRFLPYLRAGQLTHVGKATSFGLGKYQLRLHEGGKGAA